MDTKRISISELDPRHLHVTCLPVLHTVYDKSAARLKNDKGSITLA